MIDTTFDFRTDAGGKDPDSHSPTLRRYHRLLWSKSLPDGVEFTLVETTPDVYLYHRSERGEFFLTSDAAFPTYINYGQTQSIIQQLAEAENEEFMRLSYSMGGMLVFPGNKIGREMTINGAKGFNRSIADRMDLALECVRRHYFGQESRLGTVLARYADFFALFDDFRGYVDFFLLQDLVTDDYNSVRFFMPFNDFAPPAVPRDLESYQEYRRLTMEFLRARNRRIHQWAAISIEEPASS